MSGPLKLNDIVKGLKALGLAKGDRVMVHSSVGAIGEVAGGADTVIDALLKVVGPTGLVAVPTFATEQPFDRRTSATPLGSVPDKLWRRPNAVRSLHPTHSVAAIGAGADELIKDHEKAPTAYGEGTPYYNLAMNGGKVLLLGVDQDRNTTLHTAEALAHAPYLEDITATYIDDEGQPVTIPIAAMAGPHRNFIGLDHVFREKGIMTVGRIGNAVCRLMDGKAMIEATLERLNAYPDIVLCRNNECADCVSQRAKIKAAMLAKESFTLAAIAGTISKDFADVQKQVRAEGISALEITAKEYRRYGDRLDEAGLKVAAIFCARRLKKGFKLAARLGVPAIAPVNTEEQFRKVVDASAKYGCEALIMNDGAPSALYTQMYLENPSAPGFAFNPAAFAKAGEKPFLEVFYHSILTKKTQYLRLQDGTFEGEPEHVGWGNGEVKEILSMLRCRSFDGIVAVPDQYVTRDGFVDFEGSMEYFWRLLDAM